MGTMDIHRTRPRDFLLRRSISSSSILKNSFKSNLPQQNHAFTEQQNPRVRIERMNLLRAMPPPPLSLDESERIIREDIIENKREEREELPRSRRVSFSSKPKYVVIEAPTPVEKNALFYSKEEYKRIYNENINTIEQMEKEKTYPASETQYYRGLLVPRARYEREQRIKFVVSKILQEQQNSKTLDEEWVKDFSRKFSSQTTIAALYLGKIDARAAGVFDALASQTNCSLSRSLHTPKSSRRKTIA